MVFKKTCSPKIRLNTLDLTFILTIYIRVYSKLQSQLLTRGNHMYILLRMQRTSKGYVFLDGTVAQVGHLINKLVWQTLFPLIKYSLQRSPADTTSYTLREFKEICKMTHQLQYLKNKTIYNISVYLLYILANICSIIMGLFVSMFCYIGKNSIQPKHIIAHLLLSCYIMILKFIRFIVCLLQSPGSSGFFPLPKYMQIRVSNLPVVCVYVLYVCAMDVYPASYLKSRGLGLCDPVYRIGLNKVQELETNCIINVKYI